MSTNRSMWIMTGFFPYKLIHKFIWYEAPIHSTNIIDSVMQTNESMFATREALFTQRRILLKRQRFIKFDKGRKTRSTVIQKI